MSLLSLSHLQVEIHRQPILHNLEFSLDSGKVLGVIGESGSGKSMTALAIMGLLPSGASQSGRIEFDGKALDGYDEKQLCQIRGDEISMVFQEPMTALNPLHTIGNQVMECIRLHQPMGKNDALALTRETLTRCGLPPSEYPLERYPHELSGGQRQRVVIAMAVALKPKLLIADEPTTALDVTTQAEILALLRELQSSDDIALMLISHDLAVVADMADEIIIMRDGRIVDKNSTRAIFSDASQPYTQCLIEASDHVPPRKIEKNHADRSSATKTLLEVQDLVCEYALPRHSLFSAKRCFRAVDRVSFSVEEGESVGLVGESGSGKSTLTRALLGLEPVRAGGIWVDGRPIDSTQVVALSTRRELQVVFQDPYGSFNPRHKVERLVAEPLHLLPVRPGAEEQRALVVEMLQRVDLAASDASKYIHEFSGGQRQRIAIARALIIRPKLILLDEAVSALDVSVRARILDLLASLAETHGLAYLFISHDLSVVKNVTDRVLVMRRGQVVETGVTAQVFAKPQHDYTRLLLDSAPSIPG